MQHKLTVTIDKVLNNGYGMARNPEGNAIFVPGALAGESWKINKAKKKKGALWATSSQRLSDSDIRQMPDCRHFPQCGGCRLLHIKRDAEMDVKKTYLYDVLRRVGKLDQPELELHDFPAEASRIRGKFHVDQEGNLGFMGPESNHVALVSNCYVIPSSVCGLQQDLRAWCMRTGFRGEIFFATDTEGNNPVLELHGVMRSYKKDIWQIDKAAGISWIDGMNRSRWTTGTTTIAFKWNDLEVDLPPSAFFQSNPASWPLFFDLIKTWQHKYRPAHVWDVHAGSGFLSSALTEVSGFASEPDEAAYQRLKTALEPLGFKTHRATAEQVLELNLVPTEILDGAILDPPRSGLEAPMRQWLQEQGPHALLYISCDMASFARDLKSLGETYRIDSPIHVMNLNPGTLKLELAVMLVRNP